MPNSIFDSESEGRVFRRLDSVWKKYVDVYPQVPVRKVLGYGSLMSLNIADRAKDYLLRTEFDFVVCEKGSTAPFLAVEFDGIGRGISKGGEYVPVVLPANDPHRKLKLDAKLRACDLVGFPLVVLSFPETYLLSESESAITVLDAVIAEVRSALGTHKLIASNCDVLASEIEGDLSREAAGIALWELELQSDMENNPLRRKAAEIFSKIGHSSNHWQPLRDREGYVGIRKGIFGAIGPNGYKMLVSVDIYVRGLFIASNVADCIADYCLAKKALRQLGVDPSAWQRCLDETPWTQYC